MNSLQRVIKYLAIAFAILLAVGIISAIASVFVNVVSAVTGTSFFGEDEDRIDFSEDFTGVESLNIKNSSGELFIKTGDTFRVEAEDVPESFSAKVSLNGTLTITERDRRFSFLWFNFNGINNFNSKITVYLPEDFVAEDVKIDSGAGNVVINGLSTEYLNIDAGAGNISGSNLVAEEVELDGGVGNINLTEVSFSDTEIDCGVGNLDIRGELLGDNDIDCGVGEVDLELIGSEEDYELDVNSGVGKVRVNGEKVPKDYRNKKNAAHSLKIDGGVGSVDINFTKGF